MAVVRVTTQRTPDTRLEWVPREEWKDLICQKADRVKQSLNVRLDEAIGILDELEAVQAWGELGENRESFLRFRCGITAERYGHVHTGYMEIMARSPGEQVSIERAAQAGKARAEKDAARRGRPSKEQDKEMLIRAVGTVFPRGSNNADHLRRRLAQSAPEVLAAWVRGEHPSVRAAAMAAGIIKDKTLVERAMALWLRMSVAERDELLALQIRHGLQQRQE